MGRKSCLLGKIGPEALRVVRLFENQRGEIAKILGQIWIPQEVAEEKIYKLISSGYCFADYRVVLSGETKNITLYLIWSDYVLLFTPFAKCEDNIIFQEIQAEILHIKDEILYVVRKTKELISRLNLPKVLLINLSIKEVFPVPRFGLGVACLASYLRKCQKAKVKILDMQLNISVDDIMDEVRNSSLDIIGVSINFGQYNLACQILDLIFSECGNEKLIVAGNAIASFAYEDLLKKYPRLVICHGEGENTLVDLVTFSIDRKSMTMSEVSGIVYSENGEVHQNEVNLIDVNDVTLPAMDTLVGIIDNGGALTMEMSRGCCYGACTFCPRTHKRIKWSGIKKENVVEQLEYYKVIFDNFSIRRRIFFADEEFLGWMEDGEDDARMCGIMQEIISMKLNMSFDQDTRVDQVYNPAKSNQWHYRRIETLIMCKKAGLDRLLIGVESGSDSVLRRFNKKILSEQSIFALRLLSALGIGMRITFITLDPLMELKELDENIEFLERKDAFLRRVDMSEMTIPELFEAIHDEGFVEGHSLNIPVYEQATYMLVNLEALLNSQYSRMLKSWEQDNEKELILDYANPDYNMARYKVKYVDERIGMIASYCQAWIDRNFSLDYCLKGYYKVATQDERKILFIHRARYRKLSLELLKSLVRIAHNYEVTSGFNQEIFYNLISPILEKSVEHMGYLVSDIALLIKRGDISDTGGRLLQIVDGWNTKTRWELINP